MIQGSNFAIKVVSTCGFASLRYCRSPYKYSHHVKIALDGGLNPNDILAIALETQGKTSTLDLLSRTVLSIARWMDFGSRIPDELFEILKQNLDSERIVDVLFLISFYCGFVRFAGALEIEVEPSYADYLANFPLPS